jgi:hypothetical protein
VSGSRIVGKGTERVHCIVGGRKFTSIGSCKCARCDKMARKFHRHAPYDYAKIRGLGHPETLNAMSRLAAVHTKTLAFPEAISLLDQAVVGLRKKRGEGHEDTMVAIKELGIIYLEWVIYRQGQPDDLNQVDEILQEVVP